MGAAWKYPAAVGKAFIGYPHKNIMTIGIATQVKKFLKL